MFPASSWRLAASWPHGTQWGIQSSRMAAAHTGAGGTFWRWNAAAWLGIGLIGATQTVFVMRSMGMHHNWTAVFTAELLAWVPWALATPLVFRMARRYPVGAFP